MQWLDESCQNALDDLSDKKLRRYRPVVEPKDSRTFKLDGIEYLQFATNDYLALSVESSSNNAQWGAAASPVVAGHTRLHHQFELKMAEYLEVEACLYFNSGFTANEALLKTLLRKDDLVFADRLNHASLIDGVRQTGARQIRYQHLDCIDLRQRLEQHRHTAARKFIVTDAVFSMDGDLADLNELHNLAQEFNAAFIVDDAHGFGVFGQGRGSCAELKLAEKSVDAIILTCGKAMGVGGAVIAGKQVLIDYLMQYCRPYVYSTASSPMLLQACLSALHKLRHNRGAREHLGRLSRLLTQELERCAKVYGCHVKAQDQMHLSLMHPVQPFIVGDIDKLFSIHAYLKSQGIYVSAIRPPTVPMNTARLRISLNAAHTESDIIRLIEAIDRFYSST